MQTRFKKYHFNVNPKKSLKVKSGCKNIVSTFLNKVFCYKKEEISIVIVIRNYKISTLFLNRKKSY